MCNTPKGRQLGVNALAPRQVAGSLEAEASHLSCKQLALDVCMGSVHGPTQLGALLVWLVCSSRLEIILPLDLGTII